MIRGLWEKTETRLQLLDEKPPEPSNQEELDKLLSGMEGELASLTMDDQIMTLVKTSQTQKY